MASSHMMFQVNCSVQRPSISPQFEHFKCILSSAFKPFTKTFQQLPRQINVQEFIKKSSTKFLDAFVDSVFEFVDHPLLPSQSNFAPINELTEAIVVTSIEGKIPDDFPLGVYIRNGSNPLYGGLKSTKSVFGKSAPIWVEGEGMLHAMYFNQGSDGSWTVVYNNRHVETETFLLEKQRNKPSFIPAAEGDSPAILSGVLFNFLRFGQVCKNTSNTNIFEHGGKLYSIAESHMPQEIDIYTLANIGNWDVNGAWNRPFTSHPKKVPGTGELVITGLGATKPYLEMGVISADGNELVNRVDLKLDRCTFAHDLGVTERYAVIMDFPLTIDIYRLFRGGPLIEYKKEEYARVGVIPHYGDANSIRWFDVEPNCTFHIFNCFEDGDEVVVWGCRARDSVLQRAEVGLNKFESLSKRLESVGSSEENFETMMEGEELFTRCYEWRLNMQTGEVKETYLTGNKYCMDFPIINEKISGVKNKYGYAQVVDAIAGAASGMPKFGGIAKLCFEESDTDEHPQRESDTEKKLIKVEHHKFEENTFGTGATFVPKEEGLDEDDGWILTFVHNEDTNVSQVYIIDAKKFSGEPVAKITLPYRVPYGFHAAFMPIARQNNF